MRKNVILLMVGLLVVITANAQWVQVGSGINGENTGDNFGRSVSISEDGMIMASGAHHNSENGSDAGQVRVFEQTANQWVQLGADLQGQTNEGFGYSVSINGDGSVVAVGVPNSSGPGGVTGCVRVFQYNDGAWAQIGEDINAEANGDLLGYSVSLNSGGTIVACGSSFNDGSFSDAGHVRVFELINGSWTQLGDDIDGEAMDDYSGYAIGAPGNAGNGFEAGHVRVYRFLSGTWVQLGSDIDADAAGDYLGYSVSLNDEGDILAAGAIFAHLNGVNSGCTNVYKFVNGSWVRLGDHIVGENTYDFFGSSVSLNAEGDIVAAGAASSGNAIQAGTTRVFQFVDDAWVQIGDNIDGASQADDADISVSLSASGADVAIGSDRNSNNAGINAGQVRIFHNATVGMSEITIEDASFYPNPTIGHITLNMQDMVSPDVYVYDAAGKMLYHKEIEKPAKSLSIDLTEHHGGIYMLKVYDGQKMFSGRIIKE